MCCLLALLRRVGLDRPARRSVTVIVYATSESAPEKNQNFPFTARPSTSLTISSRLFR